MPFKLQKPNITEVKKEKILKLFPGDEIFEFIKKSNASEYLFWDKFKYKEPAPKNVSREQLWLYAKIVRASQMLKTPILDKDNKYFEWMKLSDLEEFFHSIDLNTGGELFASKYEIDKNNKQKLVSRGVMEEAIASSQLEGAATSRKVAKRFLREGRKPRNESEQMILNNYLTMQILEDEYKNRKMDNSLLLELHNMITKDTLTHDGEPPRFRKVGDDISVVDSISGKIYHQAPNIDFVKKELEKFILFANDELKIDYFIHPVIKSIMLHFWIGYLHPFTDGNGRLARIIFYWYLLRKGYWAFAYIPISKIIKKSPMQYAMAYIYSEQDDNDLTYFIDYNIRKIKLAVEEFRGYVDKEQKKNMEMNKKTKLRYSFNERQIQLLQYFYGVPEETTSLKVHMSIYQVSKITAIKDLRELEKKGFLISKKQGRNIYYYPSEKMKGLF